MFKIAVCFVDAKDGILNYANSQRLLLTLNIELVDPEKLKSFEAQNKFLEVKQYYFIVCHIELMPFFKPNFCLVQIIFLGLTLPLPGFLFGKILSTVY